MNKNICFFEPNMVLAERMVDYWMSHGLERYSISTYSDEGLFLEHAPKISARMWILDVSVRGRIPIQSFDDVLWLSNSQEEPDTIFKYRSAAVLLQMILNCLRDYDTIPQQRTEPFLISLYTPVHRSLQTTFGITLSHILSRKGRTLYLNLEGYSGFEKMFPDCYSKDISDFIYSFTHSKEKIPTITANFIYRLGEVDMIPPVLNAANLQEITGETWQDMLRVLQESKVYDYIVVDISDFTRGVFDILKISQVIFSLTQNDEQAGMKWQQYCGVLETLGLEEIIQRTQKMSLPHISMLPKTFEEYVPSAFSEYVEQSAKEVGLL